MNKKLFSIFLFLFSVNVLSQTSAPERDTQIWHETTVTFLPYFCKDKKCGIGFLKEFSANFAGTLRIGRDASRPVDERIGGGIEMKFNDYFTFSPSYLYRAGQPAGSRKEYEHRIRFDGTFQYEKKKVITEKDTTEKDTTNSEQEASKSITEYSIKNRNRIEYRIRHSRNDSVRYRNKTTFKYTIYNDNNEELFSPFIADEPFYDFSAKAWTRNEFSVGISKDFKSDLFGLKKKKITTEFFYLLQNNRGTSFKYLNAFGVNLKIDLRTKD